MPTPYSDSSQPRASGFDTGEADRARWSREGLGAVPVTLPLDDVLAGAAADAANDVSRMRDLLLYQGYVVLRDFLSESEVRRLRDDLLTLPDRFRGKSLPRGAAITWEESRPGDPPRANQVFDVHRLSEAVDDLAHGSRLAAAVEPFLGPHPTLFHTKFIEKAARVGSEIPWHQDLSYWLEGVRSHAMLTCMIYLDDATSENGCLEVVPGSHRRGLRQARSRGGDRFRWQARENPDARAVRRIEGRAGTAILFGPLLLHRSGANTSDRSRPSISIALSDGSTWNRHIGFVGRRPSLRFHDLRVTQLRIARIHGPGPHHGGWDEFYRRRALRILARDFVRDPAREWIEVTDGFYEEDGFSWMSSRKFRGALLTRYQEFDDVRSNRSDVMVHTGDVLSKLASAQHGPAGLIALGLGTESALRSALRSLRPALADGTILFIDNFFAPRRHRGSRISVIAELASEEGMRIEFLARSDRAVVVRIAGRGDADIAFPATAWTSRAVGIGFGRQSPVDFVREEIRFSRPVQRFKDRFRPLWQGLKRTMGR